MIEQLLTSYRSVIVLDSGKINTVLLNKILQNIPIIAADGAANLVKADYIIGDGDSLLDHKNTEAKRIHSFDQDTTDFEKCIKFTKQKKLFPSLVFGINGGEIDHVLGNVQVLLKHAKGLSLFFLDDYQKNGKEGIKIGLPFEKGTYKMQVKSKATVSILPFGSCKISTKGLVWELKEKRLTPKGLLAIRNQAKQEHIEFHVLDGKALIVIDI